LRYCLQRYSIRPEASVDGGITWTATLTPTVDITDATNLITLDNTALADLAGNAGMGTTSSGNYAIDTLRPSVTSFVVADSALTAGETSAVTIVFNEAVTGFTTADLMVANGTLNGLSSSDGGITWTANLTPTAGITEATNLLTLNNSGIADLAGNTGTGTTSSNNYAIDTLAPVISSVSVPANGIYGAGTALNFTINFSEAITVNTSGGTPYIALVIGTHTHHASYISGSGSSALQFSTTVQAGWLDTNGITVGMLSLNGGTLKDVAGNDAVLTLNSVGSTAAVLVDGIAPDAPSAPTLQSASDSGHSSSDGITGDATPTLTGTAEAGVTVSLYDGATLLGSTTADGSGNWSITSTVLADASYNLVAKARDAAGNESVVSSPLAIAIDTTAPNLNAAGSTPADNATGVSISNDIALTFSEPLHAASSDLSRVYLKSAVTDALVPATITINADGALVINPTGNLAYATGYYVSWDAGALLDLAGNAAAAVTDKTTLDFTTRPAPSSPLPTPPDGDNVSSEEEDSIPGLPTPGGGAPLQGDGVYRVLMGSISFCLHIECYLHSGVSKAWQAHPLFRWSRKPMSPSTGDRLIIPASSSGQRYLNRTGATWPPSSMPSVPRRKARRFTAQVRRCSVSRKSTSNCSTVKRKRPASSGGPSKSTPAMFHCKALLCRFSTVPPVAMT